MKTWYISKSTPTNHARRDGPSPPFSLFLSLQWNPLASLKAFSGNPLLKTTAKITLLYYTSVWAVVSTLMVYVARQFHFGPVKVRKRVTQMELATIVSNVPS